MTESTNRGWTGISDRAALTALLGEPTPRARDKARQVLTDVDIAWLEAAPLCMGHRPLPALVVQVDEYYGPSYADGLYREPVV